ncbi:MAG: hypothetical protein JWN32_133 [Solirubrobacterales bacterium]|nr:hypothetical protein [Solirubrobacterales bacterium]
MRHIRASLIGAVLAMSVWVTPAMAADGTISGTITEAGGTPVANVHVLVFTAQDTLAADPQADSSGHYSIGLGAGTYRVLFSPSWLTGLSQEYYDDQVTFDAATPVTVTSGHDTTAVDAVLSPGASIAGTVTSGGAPVADAVVNLFRDGLLTLSATTGSDGTYTIGGLTAGAYRLGFEPTGNALGEYYAGAANLADATPISLIAAEQRTGVDVVLPQGGEITGTVRNAAGAAIPGAHLWVGTGSNVLVREAATTAAGTFVAPGLRTGSYWLEAEAAGVGARIEGVPVTAGQITSGVVITLATSQPPPVAAPARPKLSLLGGRTVTVTGRHAPAITLACAPTIRCAGKATLRAASAARPHHARKTVVLGSSPISIAAGGRRTIKIDLSRAGRRLLGSSHRTWRATLVVAGTAGATIARWTVRLRT